MALQAGIISITFEFAKDLKDKDWFGKQDPYCVFRVGTQQFRTRTAKDGGRNPVWHETFKFNVISENSVEVELKDEDVGRDDLIGVATVSLTKARQAGSDRLQVPVMNRKRNKHHGFLSVALHWEPQGAPPPTAHAPSQPAAYALPYSHPGAHGAGYACQPVSLQAHAQAAVAAGRC